MGWSMIRRPVRVGVVLTSLWACGLLSGCVVMGASSRGGFFIWPGGLGLVLVVLLLLLVLRRR